MQFLTLQTRATALVSFEGWSDTLIAADWPTLVNQAWQEFSWDAEVIVGSEIQQTVAGVAVYNLQNVYKELLDVTLAGRPLLRSIELIERNLRPDWNTQAAGTPRYWTLSAFNTLTLIAPPGDALALYVRGVQQGQNMVLSVDQPGQVNGAGSPIPARFHDAIAYRAAVLWGRIYAQDVGQQRLAGYQDEYKTFVRDAKRDISRGYMRSEDES